MAQVHDAWLRLDKAGRLSDPIQCESSPTWMSRRDSCWRDGSRGLDAPLT